MKHFAVKSPFFHKIKSIATLQLEQSKKHINFPLFISNLLVSCLSSLRRAHGSRYVDCRLLRDGCITDRTTFLKMEEFAEVPNNLDAWIETLFTCKPLKESDIKLLCEQVSSNTTSFIASDDINS